MHSKLRLLGISLTLLGLVVPACSSKKTLPGQLSTHPRLRPMPDEPVIKSSETLAACPRWNRNLLAHLSHLSISDNGKRILVSTSAEPGKAEASLRFLNEHGKLLWRKDLKQPVKSQALASDGKLIATSTYDYKLRVYTAEGRLLWEKEHLGKPAFLMKHDRVILLNDDDSEPKIGFFSYDLKGNLKAKVTIETQATHSEPVDMIVSTDQSAVGVLMSTNEVLVYDLDGKLIWKTQLEHEAISIGVHSAPEHDIFALIREHKHSQDADQSLLRLGKNSTRVVRSIDDRIYDSLQLGTTAIFLYGNSIRGQTVAAHGLSDLSPLWKNSFSSAANYPSQIFAFTQPQETMIAALEDPKSAGRMKVMGIKQQGSAAWEADIEANDGIFSYAPAATGNAVVIGAGAPGKGTIEYFSLKPNCH